MSLPRIHLIAPAGSCRSFYSAIGAASAGQLVDIVRDAVGADYEVTARTELLDVVEDDERGGRCDDAERAEDIQSALADSNVWAVITLRGGAWFTRILPRIDFGVLDARTGPVSFFGFSELTTLANIVAAHPMGAGYYDMGPAFLTYGLRYYAERNPGAIERPDVPARDWARMQIEKHFREFFTRCVASIEGRREITINAKLLQGKIAEDCRPSFVGGNLTVLSPMIGSRYENAVAPEGKWIVLEDYNDKPERFDRFLSHLTLAGYFDRCEGVLLGDFHFQDRDLLPAIMQMIKLHTPNRPDLPILHAPTVGHTWPMDTLPLHRPATLAHGENGKLALTWGTEA